MRSPGSWQWDQAFTRDSVLGGGRRIEVRADGINITNHFNRGNPNARAEQPEYFRPDHDPGVGRDAGASGSFAVKHKF